MKLRYNNLPQDWKEGLLIGNGRLHGVVWGNLQEDIISLNHERLWTGKYGQRTSKLGHGFLSQVRQLLKEEDYFRATALASLAFSGDGGISPYPRHEDVYKPAGELIFRYDQSQQDSTLRTLDIGQGIATIQRDDITLEAFSDCVSGMLVASWQRPKKFNGTLFYEREKEEEATENLKVVGNTLVYDCTLDEQCSFKVVVEVHTDGDIIPSLSSMSINNATYITTYTNIGVSFEGIENAFKRYPFPTHTLVQLRENHCTKFKKEMGTWDIGIEDKYTQELSSWFINERVERVRQGHLDANLMEIYAKFGVYIFVAGSICGEMPLNLQGKWNCDLVPPWFCDYHTNINLQMNYWFSEQLGYPQFTKQLLDYIDTMADNGRQTAMNLYGCRGTYIALNGDHWGLSTPEAYNYAAWIGGAAWMAQHYWWHYQYNGELKFLSEVAYPFFKETVAFYMDYIVMDEDNKAQLSPSQSPENRFEGTGYFPVSMCNSSAMDVQLAYDAFSYAINTSKILGVDQEECLRWQEMQDSLPDFKIGSHGRLLEWDDEKKEEVEKGHRHYSHLYGIFPSELFNPLYRVEQFEAGRRSLDYRLAQNGGGTGWSRAWASCLYARLCEGDKAYEQLNYLLTELSSTTLLDLHPKPGNCKVRNESSEYVFQIDGNLGATRAVLECNIQSIEGKIYLLPALPKAWAKGHIKGVKTVGGHKIDLSYNKGKITYLKIVMGYEEEITIDNTKGLIEGPEVIKLKGVINQVFILVNNNEMI